MESGLVKRLVTFQSPGISDIPISDIEALADKVTHHIATRDVVDLAGGFNVPGKYIVHQLPGILPMATHTYDLLASDDQNMYPYDTYPWSYKLKALPSEIVREALGVALTPLVLAGRGIKAFASAVFKGASSLFSYVGDKAKKLFKTKVAPTPELEDAPVGD